MLQVINAFQLVDESGFLQGNIYLKSLTPFILAILGSRAILSLYFDLYVVDLTILYRIVEICKSWNKTLTAILIRPNLCQSIRERSLVREKFLLMLVFDSND